MRGLTNDGESVKMSHSEINHRPTLGTVIEALHDSEINGSVSWIYDGTWQVTLGDTMNGILAEAAVNSPQEAAEWLRANAVRRFPHSAFARRFPRSAISLQSDRDLKTRHHHR